MQKTLRILALTTMLAPAVALAGPGAGNAPESPMDRMAEKLGLSDKQQSEIEAIIKKQRQKQIALQQETQKQINEVLTDEQRQKLEDIQKQRQEQMRQRLEQMKKQQGESAPAQ